MASECEREGENIDVKYQFSVGIYATMHFNGRGAAVIRLGCYFCTVATEVIWDIKVHDWMYVTILSKESAWIIATSDEKDDILHLNSTGAVTLGMSTLRH